MRSAFESENKFLQLSSPDLAKFRKNQAEFLNVLEKWFGRFSLNKVSWKLTEIKQGDKSEIYKNSEIYQLAYSFELDSGYKKGFVVIDEYMANFILSIFLGEETDWNEPPGNLSSIEAKLIEDAVLEILNLWETAWGFNDGTIKKATYLEQVDPGEYIIWSCEWAVKLHTGTLFIALPAGFKETLLVEHPNLHPGISITLPEYFADETAEVMIALAGTSLTLGEIESLLPGDVIELDKSADDEMELLIESKPVFKGRLVQRSGVPGFIITSLNNDEVQYA